MKKMNKLYIIFFSYCFLNITALYANTCGDTSGSDLSGIIIDQITLTKSQSPYCITDDLIIGGNTQFTIEPGVIVKFLTEPTISKKLNIIVLGKIVARGTQDDQIIFTSSNPSPSPGDWGSIHLRNNSKAAIYDENGEYVDGSIFEYVIVEYGGSVDDKSTIKAEESPFMKHVTIRNNKNTGVYFTNSAQLVNCVFINNNCLNNPSAVAAESDITIINSIFQNNTSNKQTILATDLKMENSICIENDGENIVQLSNGSITRCSILNNSGIGVVSDNYTISIAHSNIYSNDAYNIYNDSPNNITVTTCFLGAPDINTAMTYIYDKTDNPNNGNVIVEMLLTQMTSDAPQLFSKFKPLQQIILMLDILAENNEQELIFEDNMTFSMLNNMEKIIYLMKNFANSNNDD